MSNSTEDGEGGIRWQTEDAADALLSDIMSDVTQDAAMEREALEAELRKRDEAERLRREEEERRQNSEIEQRLRDEEARRAAAEDERQRLMREAELARAVEQGEISSEEAGRLTEPHPVDGIAPEPDVSPPGDFDNTLPDARADERGTQPMASHAPTLKNAKPLPPETRWGLTIALVAPFLLSTAVLGVLVLKETKLRSETETELSKAKTEAASLKQQVTAKDKKIEEQKARYDRLQKQVDDALAAASADVKKDAPKSARSPAAARKATTRRAPAAPTKAVAGESKKDKKDKKGKKGKKGKRKFDLGDSIFDGGKDGKIVF